MKDTKIEKAFTLVELLCIIALLAILIAIVTVSFRESIISSKNSRIGLSVVQIRSIAERIRLERGNSYIDLCQDEQHLNQFLDPDLDALQRDIEEMAGLDSVICLTSEDSYCVSVKLVGGKGYLCVDDEGRFTDPPSVFDPCVDADSVCP